MSRRDYETVIQPSSGPILASLVEAWHRRDLVYYLMQRDLIVRYKQSLLGIAWVLLQPVAMMLIFTAVFSRIAKVTLSGPPYSLQLFAALLVWQLFATSLSRGAVSVVGHSNLVTKVYFPRLIIPIASALVPFVDFTISLVFFLIMAACFGYYPGLNLLALPIFVILTLLLSTGLSLLFSAVHVKYRDISYLIPLSLQIWMYATPVVYTLDIVPATWLPLFRWNPLVAVVEGTRWATLNTPMPSAVWLIQSVLITLGIAWIGALYFHRTEGNFSDEI